MVSLFRKKREQKIHSGPDTRQLEKECLMRLIDVIGRLRASLEGIHLESDRLQEQINTLKSEHRERISDLRARIESVQSTPKQKLRHMFDFFKLETEEEVVFQQVYTPHTPPIPQRDPNRVSMAGLTPAPPTILHELSVVQEGGSITNSSQDWDGYEAFCTEPYGGTDEESLLGAYGTISSTPSSELPQLPVSDLGEGGDHLGDMPFRYRKLRQNRESFNLDLLFAPLE